MTPQEMLWVRQLVLSYSAYRGYVQILYDADMKLTTLKHPRSEFFRRRRRALGNVQKYQKLLGVQILSQAVIDNELLNQQGNTNDAARGR